MAVTYGFYNALEHDRLYDAIQMSSIFDGIIQDGIFSTIGTSMIVTAPEDGMYVDVGPGRAWFNHTWTYNDTIYPIEAEEAEVVLDRIDAVVLEVNSSAEVRANRIYFVKGTPSSNPVKPTLIHNPEVNQYALAYVHIRAGQTTIFQQDIENVVGTDETPFVTGLLQQVSVERLLLQWDDEFHRYFANFKRVSEADLATWFNARKDEYDAWFADMEREGAEDLETFDAWFQHMKDQLDEDAAGHLQAEIDELAEACEKGSVLTVTTDEPDLIGRTCTVSQGLNSINKQFDSNGVAEFPSVPYIGNDIDIRATYGDNIAQTVITIPYFGRYGADIAFWAATLDIRSTVETLYGRTITISKGGSVVGTTTFDNTGHAVYKVHETGTYHIYTSTAGGDVYEDDVVVTEETLYSIELGLPNGNTALPVNDIQIWLKCAGITDKEYLQTLEDVLNEPETYELLLSDSNACDYMARSTDWAGRIGLVPPMTSATTPSGEVFGTTPTEGNIYYVFDGSTEESHYWLPTVSSSHGYGVINIGYEFDTPTVVNRISIRNLTNYRSNLVWTTKTFYFKGSNDGTTWTTIGDLTTISDLTAGATSTFDFANTTAYQYYAIFPMSNKTPASGTNLVGLHSVQFHETGIATDADAMRILGKYDYACEALLSDSTWASAIANSTYYGSVLDVKVPTMTSNTTPSGTAFASSENSANGYDAWKAFDGSDSTWWGTTNSSSTFTNIYVGYTFTEATVIASYYVKFNTSVTACTYKLQGSNDGTNWTDIGSTNTTLDDYTYVTNDTAYTSYRLFIVSETLDSAKLGGRVLTLQFYGRHEAQTDIIHSAPSDTIYYMSNGSPVTLCTTDANGIGEVDWSNLPTGNITLYSSVAKNPDDLTADYSKTIKVTKNKVEAWLMPDKGVLYWWGWSFSDIKGTSYSYSSANTTKTPTVTNNTNSIRIATTGSSSDYSRGSAFTVDKVFPKNTKITNFKTICKTSSVNFGLAYNKQNNWSSSGNGYLYDNVPSSSSFTLRTVGRSDGAITTTNDAYLTILEFVDKSASATTYIEIAALWYE